MSAASEGAMNVPPSGPNILELSKGGARMSGDLAPLKSSHWQTAAGLLARYPLGIRGSLAAVAAAAALHLEWRVSNVDAARI